MIALANLLSRSKLISKVGISLIKIPNHKYIGLSLICFCSFSSSFDSDNNTTASVDVLADEIDSFDWSTAVPSQKKSRKAPISKPLEISLFVNGLGLTRKHLEQLLLNLNTNIQDLLSEHKYDSARLVISVYNNSRLNLQTLGATDFEYISSFLNDVSSRIIQALDKEGINKNSLPYISSQHKSLIDRLEDTNQFLIRYSKAIVDVKDDKQADVTSTQVNDFLHRFITVNKFPLLKEVKFRDFSTFTSISKTSLFCNCEEANVLSKFNEIASKRKDKTKIQNNSAKKN